MTDMICRKSMQRCQTPGMCSPHGGCRPSVLVDTNVRASACSGAVVADTNKMRDPVREQFQVEYASYAGISVQEVASEWDGDLYGDQGMRDAWWAWQASRQALVIELPKAWQTNVGAMLPPNGVRFAIQEAGLKVKP